MVGIDVGGTLIKAAVAGPDGAIHRRFRTSTGISGGEAFTSALGDVAERLCAETAADGYPAQAVGIAVPGIVDHVAGVARYAANLDWKDAPVAASVERRVGLPVVLGHDGRAAAAAEAVAGAARGVDDFLFVALGTGVAGAVTYKGRAWHGHSWLAGEIGHVVVDPSGDRCNCGNCGCLETFAGSPALVRRYHAATGASLEPSRILRLATDGDEAARRVVEAAIAALGQAVAAVQTLLDLELVVVGGGLVSADAGLLGALETALTARLPYQTIPKVVPAELGADAGAIGAALLARHRLAGEEW